ncbi:hypothetical protein L3Y34_003136 [Caenorhabditis briggsae]|uniref:Uncharacterized protein n=1 Tax=Caenorhabditis briggsae TaxID=6238 RepID=A0AAE9D5I1_CAEBR|nr:hypothetical protein L3Y34_003136 [Caenorhabditis briggsae]
MLQYFLVLLFPLVVFGQYETASPVVTDQQCQEEYDKIRGCVRELVNEITHVLNCSGILNCNSSIIL